MPLMTLSSAAALERLRENRWARWPDGRRDGRRLEGLVLPHAVGGFQLRPGGTVFTAGSCFARHIEARLERMGFEVPARHVILPEDERGSSAANELLNKYNPQSIVNELIWAFERPFPDGGYLDLGDGLWSDPHLFGGAGPAPLVRLRERREQVVALFRQLPRCDAVIITLGLVEAWFDKRVGLYLNTAPPAAAMAQEPDRFRFDVLDHGDVLTELERMWALIRAHGHPEVRMLVTVSPVPLRATYTGQDVLVANSYSKSVLRAAVGAFAAAHPSVDYFPSYEAAMLTARASGFMEDNRHVAPPLVNAIMDRVARSYVGVDEAAASIEDEAAEGGTIEWRLRRHLKLGRLISARKLMASLAPQGDFAAAGYDEFQFRYVYAKILTDLGSELEAEVELRRCLELQPRSAIVALALGRVLLRLRQPLGAEEAFRRAVTSDPTNRDARVRLGRTELGNGKSPDAERTALAALALWPDSDQVIDLLVEIRVAAAAEWQAADRGTSEWLPVLDGPRGKAGRRRESRLAAGTIAGRVRARLAAGRSAAALRLLRGVAKSGDFAGAGYGEFQFHYTYGKALGDTRALDAAELAFRRCIDIEPASALAHHALGLVLTRGGRDEPAERAFHQATLLGPNAVDDELRQARETHQAVSTPRPTMRDRLRRLFGPR